MLAELAVMCCAVQVKSLLEGEATNLTASAPQQPRLSGHYHKINQVICCSISDVSSSLPSLNPTGQTLGLFPLRLILPYFNLRRRFKVQTNEVSKVDTALQPELEAFFCPNPSLRVHNNVAFRHCSNN
jgi:hypothetical protein